MPPIFKALTTITAWTLFVSGWLWLLVGGIITSAGEFGGAEPPCWRFYTSWGLAGYDAHSISVCHEIKAEDGIS